MSVAAEPAAAAEPLLRVEGLSLSYGGVRALREVTLDVPRGQVTCIMGRNGVGKTTLMRAIMGTLRVDAGQVLLGGRDVAVEPPHRRARLGLGLVPQGREIFPRLTVADNLRVALSARADGMRAVPPDVYDLFPILRSFAKRMGGDLSGGQQQQLAIARALVGNPRVLLLDEPTEGIQPNIIQEIGAVLRRLVGERGMTIVLVEQYLDFVKEFGQRFHIMNRGQVVATGAIADLHDDHIAQHLSV